MTTLFAASYASDNARTQGEMKTVFETIRSVLAELIGGSAPSAITLASDSFTVPNNSAQFVVSGEASAADDLSTITATNCRSGHVIMIRRGDQAITVKNAIGGAGQIYTMGAADWTMNSNKQFMILEYDAALGSGSWREVFRSYADQKSDFRTYWGFGTAAVCATGNSAGNVPLAQTVFDNVTSQGAGDAAKVVASPASGAGALSLRALVAGDLPTVTLAKGGTGFTTAAGALKSLMIGAGGGVYKELTGGTALQILQVNSGGTDLEWGTLAAMTVAQGTLQAMPGHGSYYDYTHGLGVVPKLAWITLECVTDEGGFVAGDKVISLCFDVANSAGVVALVTDTTARFRFGSYGTSSGVRMLAGDTGTVFILTSAKWNFRPCCAA